MGRATSDPAERTQVIERVKAEDIDFVLFWFTDIVGQLKSFAVTIAELEGALDDGMGFDGSSITGFNSIEESDMAELAAYDAPRFGADRRFLLEHLQGRLPGCALVAESGSRIRGYVLGRDGQTCSQIGPVVAEQEETAICLIAGALAASSGAVCIDVGNRHQALIDTLGASGFAPQFPFIRMIHERNEPFDDPARVFAIAGPELG